MKKVVAIIAIVFCTVIFTSCTDEAVDLEERMVSEKSELFSDKDEEPDRD